MKSPVSWMMFLTLVTLLQLSSGGSDDLSKYVRQLQADDERWTWGPSGDMNSPQKDNVPPSPPPEEPGTIKPEEEIPCYRQLPDMPNFSVPGRKVSIAKCYEYIWEIKNREEKIKKEKDCQEYIKTHPDSGIFTTAAIGGRDALPGEFPHMGAIGWKATLGTWVFKCGGTLISEKFVLTAAHCTMASALETDVADVVPKIVRFGDKNIIDTFANGISPIDSEITRIIVHPDYKSPMKYNDIALMELIYRMVFNENVQPACLWTNFDVNPLGKQAAVTGWGIFESGGRDTSPVLKISVVNFIDSETCDRLLRIRRYRLWCGVNETQVCAGVLAGGVDACQGDSGGPLSVKIPLPKSTQGAMHHVVGVTAFGFGCALKDTPGVYTRVSSFVPWIEGIVWPS